MQRKSTDIAYPLAVLQDCQLIRREIDPVLKRSPSFPARSPLASRRAADEG
ncbi:MAG: hypothetical protein ACRDQ7_19135 [Haloechinothrix sp.]